ncbi:MAG TPA: STAS domain-containing protein [Solirubrobacteraceae bacterium]|nr:STAS domain-containing protein [Solirubrobacteraceae bacterium]
MAGLLAPLTKPRLDRVGGRAWIATAGPRLCDEGAARFAVLVESAVQDGCVELVLDLSEVDDIDSTGAIALCEIEIALTEAGAEVAVAAAHPLVLSTLRSAQLDLVWPVSADRETALAGLLAAPVGMQPA